MEKLNLSYLTVGAAKSYSFYMIPKELIDNESFDDIDYGSKLLYALMLNRASLSAANPDFIDNNGNVYIIYTVEQVMSDMRCSNKTAIKMLNQLENIGLIEKRRQGQGKPSIIFVKDFSSIHFKKCKKYTSRSVKNTLQEVNNLHSSNTDSNNTDFSNKSINQTLPVDNVETETIDTIDIDNIKKQVAENIALENLQQNNPTKQKEIQELYAIIIEILASRKKSFRIAKEELPAPVVKEAFSRLNALHIEYVLQSLKSTTTAVKSTKAYLLTTLYNAAHTMNNHYSLAAQHQLSENSLYQPR